MTRFLRYGAAAIACMLLTALPAAAQFDRGQISGTIKDAQGAVVPGVTVSATQLDTQTVRNTVTDSSGFYTFPNLPPGKYDVAAELTALKQDPALAAIPVILVTSLYEDQDRKRGLTQGAEAYLIKQKFEQQELLDVIGQLL
mgnify:CR=1 FL=1